MQPLPGYLVRPAVVVPRYVSGNGMSICGVERDDDDDDDKERECSRHTCDFGERHARQCVAAAEMRQEEFCCKVMTKVL